jgi:AraC-like DNA-binding protein
LVPLQHQVSRIDRHHSPIEAVKRFRPDFVCAEFDYPDKTCLRAVEAVCRTFPELPMFVLTEHHSEALAVWALRIRVWDYRVKPVDSDTFTRCIGVLADATQPGSAGSKSWRRLPPDLVERAGHLRRPPTTTRRTSMAVGYIANYFAQDLSRRKLADLCHLSVSEFSRAFRREQGTTFEDFLLAHRIAQARELLAERHSTIGAVAYAVGFNDPAYFSRAFRKLVGVTASEYRRGANERGIPPERIAHDRP